MAQVCEDKAARHFGRLCMAIQDYSDRWKASIKNDT